MSVPYRQIRAAFDEQTVTVYQAYAPEIAAPAVAAGRFVPPFKRERMTWIKPSFLWMMYRSGWASKPGQERVLAVRILRSGFEAALAQACLSHYDRDLYPDQAAWARLVQTSQVRVQWDPERSPSLGPLPYRSLQVGLSGQVVDRYVDEWIVGISDVTDQAHAIRDQLAAADGPVPPGLSPVERPYPLPAAIGATIGVTS
ncbi:DUF4291 domain-containing protein [Solwaraspora sp. WMMD406]|uniref:DUF4291 domain-containing protein n=1 Tax=Solwaraspora sp. WMMD406 TaxID=3016095 RepID=UPI0024163876|nr:DUF4291 domain-containing protein [Solwaraspora sp. WMMD406]MDG4763768.1 DUF4291 domain-containing protein [Solwaraspora sp. WMMD406]